VRLLRLCAAALLAAAVGGATLNAFAQDYDDAIDQHRRELDDLKRQAEGKRQEARRYAKQEKNVLTRLNQAEDAIHATADYIRGLEDREGVLSADIKRAEEALTSARGDLSSRRDVLRKRLRYTHMHGTARPLEVVFSAESFPDLLRRTAFLGKILDQDRRLVSDVKSREAEVSSAIELLRSKREEVAGLQQEKEREKQNYENLRTERSKDLSQVRSEKQKYELQALELEKSARDMQALLDQLERKRQEALRQRDPVLDELDRNNFGANRGRLPWPVAGEVIGEFGKNVHPKYKTVTLNNGIDIQAPAGTDVVSVGDGVVDLVQWLNGYGLSVIVNHGQGYYSVYAHLAASHVEEGERVAPGQTVGSVGDTGSLNPLRHQVPPWPASWRV